MIQDDSKQFEMGARKAAIQPIWAVVSIQVDTFAFRVALLQ